MFLGGFCTSYGYDYVIYNLCKFKGIKTFTNYFLFPDWGYFIESIKDPMAGLSLFMVILNIPIKEHIEEYLNNKPLIYKPIHSPCLVSWNFKKSKIMYKGFI